METIENATPETPAPETAPTPRRGFPSNANRVGRAKSLLTSQGFSYDAQADNWAGPCGFRLVRETPKHWALVNSGGDKATCNKPTLANVLKSFVTLAS